VSAFVTNLVRMPGDTPAHWRRAHEPAPGGGAPGPAGGHRPATRAPILRVRMVTDGVSIGAIRAVPRPGAGEPDRSSTRLLALAADQLGLALRRDALRREATEVEIARQADALKSALLDAVSHDLRTPLASIRAQAGALADRDVPLDVAAARQAGAAIDAEAERLDRLVREVLDLSRIESGGLRPDLEAIDLGDAVGPVVDRLRPLLGDREVAIRIAADLPPVVADAVLLDGLLANLVENVARHAPAPAAVRVEARSEGDRVDLTIEDAGPGVPAGSLARLFERFHRLPTSGEGSRRGLGIGLSIVRGFAEAMGASVRAEASPLGGLRIVVSLEAAASPDGEAATEGAASTAGRARADP
jgi:two-component system sensor histidine kinase KdpD